MSGREATPMLVAAALFTLVGGGELITLTALAYAYGFGGLSLFLGYAGGFCFLAVFTTRIRGATDMMHLSLPDFVHYHFGPLDIRSVILRERPVARVYATGPP